MFCANILTLLILTDLSIVSLQEQRPTDDFSEYENQLNKGGDLNRDDLQPPYDIDPQKQQQNVNNEKTEGKTEETPAFRDKYRIRPTPVMNVSCSLSPKDEQLFDRIMKAVDDGASLIEYTVSFPEYAQRGLSDPLQLKKSMYYKPNKWHRAFSRHGQTLLSLAFNYDVLSLSLLNFGVEKMDAEVLDSPPDCFSQLSDEAKMHLIMETAMTDFNFFGKYAEETQSFGEDESDVVCHNIVKDEDGYAQFTYDCCTRIPNVGHIACADEIVDEWIALLHVLLNILKITFLLFGPLILINWLYNDTIGKTDYTVKLSNELHKTMLVKKEIIPDGTNPGQQREMRQFKKFRTNVKSIPAEEIVNVKFKKLQVLVDHRELMSEKNVPVGLFRFIYQHFFKCEIRRYEPFLTCCKESIFGSWSPKFLWISLMSNNSDCNNGCRKYISWGHAIRLLGGLLFLAIIPLPYYIRVIVFYVCEEEELSERKDKMEELGLEKKYENNMIHYLEPNHGALWFIYITYAFSFLFLSMLRACGKDKFDQIAHGAIQDLRGICRWEGFRMLLAHIVLPFEKFGLCGLFVGLIYWPLLTPVCIVTIIFYCMPTIYLTGRFLVHTRPSFCKSFPKPTSPKLKPKQIRTLSPGTTSFETCLLLENINPDKGTGVSKNENATCKTTMQKCAVGIAGSLVGIFCILFMYSLLFMYTETVGFLIEVCVFTLMGAVVNAGSAAKYVMLFFWIIIYSTSCYNRAYEKYARLTSKVFSYIKDKLKDDIKLVTNIREEKHRNTAFKYFTLAELRQQKDEIRTFRDEDSDDEAPRNKESTKLTIDRQNNCEDSIEYISGKLHWRMYNLIFFVDKKDVPRIPKDLFHEICKIEAPGCPGPVYKSLAKATRHFLYMVVFLLFVLSVVISFGAMYKLSSTNQLLVTLAGGFLPFVIRFVLTPKAEELDLSTYSFEGKVQYAIGQFSQPWPVFDLSFKTVPDANDDDDGQNGTQDTVDSGIQAQNLNSISENSHSISQPNRLRSTGADGRRDLEQNDLVDSSRENTDTTHVDLLITIRDDPEEEIQHNLNMYPGSFGSHGSLQSARLGSPQEDGANPLSQLHNQRSNPNLMQTFQNAPVDSIGAEAHEMAPLYTANPGEKQANCPPEYTSISNKYTTTAVQTNGGARSKTPSPDNQGNATANNPPNHNRTGSQSLPGSPGRPVDLVVDAVGSNIPVNKSNSHDRGLSAAAEAKDNGVPKWPKSSPYKQVPQIDQESQI